MAAVHGPVDRSLRRRTGTRCIDDQPILVFVDRVFDLDRSLGDAVFLDEILSDIRAVRDVGQGVVPGIFRAAVHDRVESGLERIRTVLINEFEDAPLHQTSTCDEGVEVTLELTGEATVAQNDSASVLVEFARVVELDDWADRALFVDTLGLDRPATRHCAADIGDMAEHLRKAQQSTFTENWYDDAVIGQMPDRRARTVHIVVDVDVALTNFFDGVRVANRVRGGRPRHRRNVVTVEGVDRGTVVVLLTDDATSGHPFDDGLPLVDRPL